MKKAIEFFPSLNALLSANSTRQTNKAFKDLNRCLDSSYESSRRTEFTGFRPLPGIFVFNKDYCKVVKQILDWV